MRVSVWKHVSLALVYMVQLMPWQVMTIRQVIIEHVLVLVEQSRVAVGAYTQLERM